jgi:hypothetical protein
VSYRGWSILLLGCTPHARPATTLPADEPVGYLGNVQTLTSAAASTLLGEPCPPGAVAAGWYYRDDAYSWNGARTVWSGVWCQDTQGRLQGPSIAVQESARRSNTIAGHYRDGIADGRFVSASGSTTYVHGRLDGECRFGDTVVTFHDGVEVETIKRPVALVAPAAPVTSDCDRARARHQECYDFSTDNELTDAMLPEPEPPPTSCPFRNDNTVHRGPVRDGWPSVLSRP